MTAVGSTRAAAVSVGSVVGDAATGRSGASINDGVFDALFARTLDGSNVEADPDERRAAPADVRRRGADRPSGRDDASAAAAREVGDDRPTVRERSTDPVAEVGADDAVDDDAAADGRATVVVPPAVVVHPEVATTPGLSPWAAAATGQAPSAPSATTGDAVNPGAVAPALEIAGAVGSNPGETIPSGPATPAAPNTPATPNTAAAESSAPSPTGSASPTATGSEATTGIDALPISVPVSAVSADESSSAEVSPMGSPAAADVAPTTPAEASTQPAAPSDRSDLAATVESPVAGHDVDPAGVADVDASVPAVPARPSTASGAEGVPPVVGAIGGLEGRSSTSGGVAGRAEGQSSPVGDPALRLDDARRAREFVGLGGVAGSTMSVDLSDEGLGHLTLHALQRNGGLHLTLSAAEQATRELLVRQGDHLRHDLESGGINLGSLDIQHSDARSAGGRDGGGRGEPIVRADALSSRPLAANLAAATVTRLARPSNDGLDLLI